MRQATLIGLVFGSLIGLLMAMLLLLLLTRPAPPPPAVPTATLPPDITIFISEQSLSRVASTLTDQPTAINFEPNGRMFVTAPVKLGIVEPVLQVELLLYFQGAEAVSQLRAAKLGFLTIPARWLPDSAQQTAAIIGETIKAQTPPDFALVGLNTNQDGLNFQLKWIGE